MPKTFRLEQGNGEKPSQFQSLQKQDDICPVSLQRRCIDRQHAASFQCQRNSEKGDAGHQGDLTHSVCRNSVWLLDIIYPESLTGTLLGKVALNYHQVFLCVLSSGTLMQVVRAIKLNARQYTLEVRYTLLNDLGLSWSLHKCRHANYITTSTVKYVIALMFLILYLLLIVLYSPIKKCTT